MGKGGGRGGAYRYCQECESDADLEESCDYGDCAWNERYCKACVKARACSGCKKHFCPGCAGEHLKSTPVRFWPCCNKGGGCTYMCEDCVEKLSGRKMPTEEQVALREEKRHGGYACEAHGKKCCKKSPCSACVAQKKVDDKALDASAAARDGALIATILPEVSGPALRAMLEGWIKKHRIQVPKGAAAAKAPLPVGSELRASLGERGVGEAVVHGAAVSAREGGEQQQQQQQAAQAQVHHQQQQKQQQKHAQEQQLYRQQQHFGQAQQQQQQQQQQQYTAQAQQHQQQQQQQQLEQHHAQDQGYQSYNDAMMQYQMHLYNNGYSLAPTGGMMPSSIPYGSQEPAAYYGLNGYMPMNGAQEPSAKMAQGGYWHEGLVPSSSTPETAKKRARTA